MRDTRERKPYVKPEVRQVELKAQEAVLGFCKKTGVGPLQAQCNSPSNCSTYGS
jgi:hypothetical protein